jgi:hypothetical protein
MDLHENENNGNIQDTMNEISDQQKETILSKLGNVLFGGTASTPSLAVPNININIHKGLLAEEEEEVVEEKEEVKADESAAPVEEEGSVEEEKLEEEDMNVEDILKGVGSLLDEKLAGVEETLTAKIDEKVAEKLGEIEKSVADFKEQTEATIAETKEVVEKVADAGAGSKSDVADEDEVEDLKKSAPVESFWGGKFVPAALAEALGYDS